MHAAPLQLTHQSLAEPVDTAPIGWLERNPGRARSYQDCSAPGKSCVCRSRLFGPPPQIEDHEYQHVASCCLVAGKLASHGAQLDCLANGVELREAHCQ